VNDAIEMLNFFSMHKDWDTYAGRWPDKSGLLEVRYPKIVEILKDFDIGPYNYDIHDENVMMRGDTLVLTDPIFDSSDLGM
jgi:hypothetical protein